MKTFDMIRDAGDQLAGVRAQIAETSAELRETAGTAVVAFVVVAAVAVLALIVATTALMKVSAR